MIIGIVGKANVGKSTFFKAATLAEVEIANYPFATIKPNSGIGYVKVDCADKDFGVQCNPRTGYCINHKRFVPVQLIDVAGLVPGAHEGKGMGNQFLDDLRPADVLIHVIDVAGTTNEKGEPTNSSYDPANDVRFLETELDMWYLGIFKKVWDRFAKVVRQEHKDIAKAIARQFSGLKVTEELVKKKVKELELKEDITKWSENELIAFVKALRKATKPMVIACNKIDVPGAEENLKRLKNEFPDNIFIGCCAECELALKEAAKKGIIEYIPGESSFRITNKELLDERQKKALEFMSEFLKKHKTTGVQDILNVAVFDVLKYIAVFPGGINKLADKDGNVLPDCFLLPENSTALDFAYAIHTDLGDKFIRAIDVRKRITIGKEHVLKNRDVIEIISDK